MRPRVKIGVPVVRDVKMTAERAAILSDLAERDSAPADTFHAIPLDACYRARWIALVPGCPRAWVRLTDAGRAALAEWRAVPPSRARVAGGAKGHQVGPLLDIPSRIPCTQPRRGQRVLCGRPTRGDLSDEGQPICPCHARLLRFSKAQRGRAA